MIEAFSVSLIIVHIVIGFIAAIVISLRRKPATAIAWILAIIFIPFIGALVFILIGVGRLPKQRRDKQREVSELMLQRSSIDTQRATHGEPQWLDSALVLNEQLGALPMLGGNDATLIEDYQESFDSMVKDIDSAKSFVHVEFYILVLDGSTQPFFDALARASARGVKVRVLSDFVSGFMFPDRKATQEKLERIGAQWHPMLPLRPWRGQWQRPDLRNHRKLLIIDDDIGYTGSQNLIDESYLKPKNVRRGLHWLELMVRLEGPVVGELNAVFVTDWYSETNELLPLSTHSLAESTVSLDAQVVPSGPSFENDNNLKLFVLLIHNARRRISITSPYFVPDESTMLALVTAASRGVEVELFVSEVADQFFVYHAQRSYYSELLAAGVSIYLYRSPTVLHSKHFTIDEDVAVIGSSNMDIRSFSLNMEVSVLVRSKDFTTRVRMVEDNYRAKSIKLDPTAWSQRPVHEHILDALARLTSGLQ